MLCRQLDELKQVGGLGLGLGFGLGVGLGLGVGVGVCGDFLLAVPEKKEKNSAPQAPTVFRKRTREK